jgi:MFS family permease
LPQYASILGIDPTALGLAYSLYNVALIVCLIPAGIIADRVGRVKTIAVGMLLFALSSLMLVFVKDLFQFAVARVIEGVSSALAIPAVFALTADLVPADRRGSGMGFTSTVETVGGLVSPTIGGLLAQTAGLSFPFYVTFFMGLMSAALVLPIREQSRPSRPSSSASSFVERFRLLHKSISENRSLFALSVRGFIVGITQGLYVLVLVLYMTFSIPMQLAEIGFSFTIMSGAILAFTFLAGHLSDRFGRKPFVILGGIIIASGILAFTFAHTAAEIYLISFGLGLGIALNNAPINALIADCVTSEIRAQIMGGYEVIVGLGRALGVLLLGALYSLSQLAPFNLSGGLMLVTVVLVMLFVAEQPKTQVAIPARQQVVGI